MESDSFITKINKNAVKILDLKSINNDILHIMSVKIFSLAMLTQLGFHSLVVSPLLNPAYAMQCHSSRGPCPIMFNNIQTQSELSEFFSVQ